MCTLQLHVKTECELRNSGNPERILGSRFVFFLGGGKKKKIESLFKPDDSKPPLPPPKQKLQQVG
jgi:hypothetical protein